MKISTKLLIGIALILFAEMLTSNIILKQSYDKIDKNDPYYNYDKMFATPFKHLKVNGKKQLHIRCLMGNTSVLRIKKGNRALFSQSFVRNDTLFINLPPSKNDNESDVFSREITAIVFAPQLLSIENANARMEIAQFKQRTMELRVSGKGELAHEQNPLNFEKLTIYAKDQANVNLTSKPFQEYAPVMVSIDTTDVNLKKYASMKVSTDTLEVNLQDYSKLNLNGMLVKKIRLKSSDNTEIQLSGNQLRALQNE